MSVKIRLRRDGAKKRPFYHVVAADSRRARNGRFIEELGYYNPIVAADAEPILVLKEDRIRYWLSVGALPSETAAALLKKQGIIERRQPKPGAKPAVAAAPVADAAPTPDATPVAEVSPDAADGVAVVMDAAEPVAEAETTEEAAPVAA